MVQQSSVCAGQFGIEKEDHKGSTFHAIYSTSWQYEDVQRSKNYILVDQYEERSSRVCVPLFDLSASQDRASTTSRALIVIGNSIVKMGVHHHRLLDGTAQNA